MADEETIPLAEEPQPDPELEPDPDPEPEADPAEPESVLESVEPSRESMETLTVVLSKKKDGYGFNVKGGRDKPFREGDPSIYITRLRPGAVAEKDGRLSPGDRIVEVSNNDA